MEFHCSKRKLLLLLISVFNICNTQPVAQDQCEADTEHLHLLRDVINGMQDKDIGELKEVVSFLKQDFSDLKKAFETFKMNCNCGGTFVASSVDKGGDQAKLEKLDLTLRDYMTGLEMGKCPRTPDTALLSDIKSLLEQILRQAMSAPKEATAPTAPKPSTSPKPAPSETQPTAPEPPPVSPTEPEPTAPTKSPNSQQTHGSGGPYYPRDCEHMNVSGVYQIKPGDDVISAYCLYDPGNEPASTVIQRRINGSLDFNRNWNEYKNGFGDVNGEHWLGLETIRKLTLGRNCMVYSEVETPEGKKLRSKVFKLKLTNETDGYKFQFYGYAPGFPLSENAGRLYTHARQFSTFDKDNDMNDAVNCADNHGGGWWHDKCQRPGLNAKYDPANPGPSTMSLKPLKEPPIGLSGSVIKLQCTMPRDCTDAMYTGVTMIKPQEREIEVNCKKLDNTKHATIIQRRTGEPLNFEEPWVKYKEGFGKSGSDQWLGLDNINELTEESKGRYRYCNLYIDLTLPNGTQGVAKYRSFLVKNETDDYQMDFYSFDDSTSDAGDSLTEKSKGRKFSTFDRDNDENPNVNCAEESKGGWWMGDCHQGNLNSMVPSWNTFHDNSSLRATEMALECFEE